LAEGNSRVAGFIGKDLRVAVETFRAAFWPEEE
jgi:hypothetical protein